jgi:hypothetical protein
MRTLFLRNSPYRIVPSIWISTPATWYDTQANITRTARDYAERLVVEDVWAEIEARLRSKEIKNPGLFAAVHAAPESSADIRDTEDARLVIIGPRHPHAPKGESSKAVTFTEECVRTRGTANRVNRNMLVFLAPTDRALGNVEQAIRDYLAWQNIYQRADSDMNLTATQKAQAKARMDTADQTVAARIADAWNVLIKPDQPDPARPHNLVTSRCVGADRLAERAGTALRREDALIVELGPNIIRHSLTSKAPTVWKSGHVSVGHVWKLYREYAYMPRLRDISVLEDAVRGGLNLLTWDLEGFALATGYDTEAGRYEGLAIPHEDDFAGISDSTLLVMPEVALQQRSAEAGRGPERKPRPEIIDNPPEVEAVHNTEFHGVRRLDPEMYGRDWNKIASEVIAHLASVDGIELEITVDIRAHAAAGVPDTKARTVSENARVLKFEVARFEDQASE